MGQIQTVNENNDHCYHYTTNYHIKSILPSEPGRTVLVLFEIVSTVLDP